MSLFDVFNDAFIQEIGQEEIPEEQKDRVKRIILSLLEGNKNLFMDGGPLPYTKRTDYYSDTSMYIDYVETMSNLSLASIILRKPSNEIEVEGISRISGFGLDRNYDEDINGNLVEIEIEETNDVLEAQRIIEEKLKELNYFQINVVEAYQ